jgi:transgelin
VSFMEAEVRNWIERILNEKLGELSLQEELKDGVILCRVVNAIEPGICPKPSMARTAFKQMDNIANYLKACTALGVPSEDLFQTVSLYEAQDMGAVVINIHSLGRVAQSRPGFSGPTLGAKLATENNRTFDEEMLFNGRCAPTFLGGGSCAHPAASTVQSRVG